MSSATCEPDVARQAGCAEQDREQEPKEGPALDEERHGASHDQNSVNRGGIEFMPCIGHEVLQDRFILSCIVYFSPATSGRDRERGSRHNSAVRERDKSSLLESLARRDRRFAWCGRCGLDRR